MKRVTIAPKPSLQREVLIKKIPEKGRRKTSNGDARLVKAPDKENAEQRFMSEYSQPYFLDWRPGSPQQAIWDARQVAHQYRMHFMARMLEVMAQYLEDELKRPR